ncbi:MAG TPA: dethiobiotin synthase [Nitrospiraceae bacterium]
MRRGKQQASDSSPRGIFVTATDTGVGKTLVTSALMMRLTQWGIDVGVMKPIETGVSRSAKAQSDGARLRRVAGSQDPMAEVSPYVFRLPVAPLSAAGTERKTIRVTTIRRAFRALRQKHALVMVEGVGGVHVPITSSLDVSDLIHQMKLPAIVVGQSGLGGINHALLTLHALRRRKIPVVALVLNQRRPVQTKSARVQEQSTVSLLRRLAGVPMVGPIPYSPSVNRNWNEGLVRLAGTAPITKLARLVLARIIHEGSSRKRADAKRDGHSEP